MPTIHELSQFLSRLYDKGNADNRYQIHGYEKEPDDLIKLDVVVFSLRRICVPLEAYAIKEKKLTHRDLLKHNPDGWNLSPGLNLEDIESGHRGPKLSEALFNQNPIYAGRPIPESDLTSRVTAIDPILDRYILDPIREYGGNQRATVAAELGKWVVENIQIPMHEKEKIRKAISGHAV